MSRSENAPPETYKDVTVQKLARYVVKLLDQLDIGEATFWGCSTGASTVLAMIVEYPNRVKSAMLHEAPTRKLDMFLKLVGADEKFILESMVPLARNNLSGDPKAWDALGDQVHKRLRKNYIRFARGYTLTVPDSTPVHNLDPLRKRPLDWTVGALTPMGICMDNVVTATKISETCKMGTLPGLHFPYVSHPQDFADYVVKTTQKYQ